MFSLLKALNLILMDIFFHGSLMAVSFRLAGELTVYVWHHPGLTLMSVEIVIIISGTNSKITTLAHSTPLLYCTVITKDSPDKIKKKSCSMIHCI